MAEAETKSYPKKPKAAVVILNWNGRHWLERFLPEVVGTTPRDLLIVVADNGSTDDSQEWVLTHQPECYWQGMPSNEGFAGGYNLSLQGLLKDFPSLELAVLMNSDVAPNPQWWEPLARRFADNPRLGAAQPILMDYQKPTHFEYAGAAGGLMDCLGYPFAYGRTMDLLEKNQGQYDGPGHRPIFWASGACLAVRLVAFQEVGGLDARLFAHMEEIDLCWRLHRADWEVECVTQSQVRHVGGGTLQALSTQKTFLNFRNNLLILVKNLPAPTAFGVIFLRLFLDGLAGIQFVFQGKANHTWAIARAHGAFYARMGSFMLFPSPWPKKWPSQGVYKGSIVWYRMIRRGTKTPPL